MSIYKNILDKIDNGEKLFAVLIDPDKFKLANTESFTKKINTSIATHVFVGGSIVDANATEVLVVEIKKYTNLPIVLFPGDVSQITDRADVLLFLSLLSGRHPDYLIGKHVEAVSKIRGTNLEIIPTGYILVESGVPTAVQKVTNTKALSRNNIQLIVDTAKAGELLGMKLMYLEAGSGAKFAITKAIITAVKAELKIPILVGGGMRSKLKIEEAYHAGANMVIVGTAFEEDESFFDILSW